MEDNKRKQVMPDHNSATSERGKPRFLGNMTNPKLHSGYTESVFDINWLSPTIDTHFGGGFRILLVRKL